MNKETENAVLKQEILNLDSKKGKIMITISIFTL